MNSTIDNSEIFHFFAPEEARTQEFSPKQDDTGMLCGDKILNVATYLIVPNRSQPRCVFNGNNIIRLADSIKRYGMLQPLTVRRHSNEENCEYYELVAGERRLRAAKLLGMRTVPCVLVDADDSRSAELAIIENLLREDLNMFEQAQGFKKLIENHKLTQEEVALRVSMSQSGIANKLRLLKLTPEQQELILGAELTERHARALLKISNAETRTRALNHIIAHRLNVCAAEEYIERTLERERALLDGEDHRLKQDKNALNPSKIDVFCSCLEKSIKNMRERGCLISSTREDLDNMTVLTIKISKSE